MATGYSGPPREVPGWGQVRMYLWKQISDNDIENIKNKIEITCRKVD